MIFRKIDAIAKSAETYPHLNKTRSPRGLTTKEYIRLMTVFMQRLAYYIITTGARIEMPIPIGSFQAMSATVKNTTLPDWTKTKKGGKLVTRRSTTVIRGKAQVAVIKWLKDDYFYKIPGEKTKRVATFSNARQYMFKPARQILKPYNDGRKEAEVHLYPFFYEKGQDFYQKIYTDR